MTPESVDVFLSLLHLDAGTRERSIAEHPFPRPTTSVALFIPLSPSHQLDTLQHGR